MNISLLPGLDVSRETEERLRAYSALIGKWTKSINLIAPAGPDEVWSRHILDSAQLFPIAGRFRSWADLGSGGGLPGLVIAILAAEAAPDASVTLVESDGRKAAFLATVCRELGLTSQITNQRIESLNPLDADIVSARALKPLPELLDLVSPHLAPGGKAILPKGRRAEEEIAAARHNWSFELTRTPSITDPQASVLVLERISRA